MKKRPSYTKEFKLEAVRLLERSDKSAADLARELGIRHSQLYKWQEQFRIGVREEWHLLKRNTDLYAAIPAKAGIQDLKKSSANWPILDASMTELLVLGLK